MPLVIMSLGFHLSGYSFDDTGHGTLWFDSTGSGCENKAEESLRLFSWDSGGDNIGSTDPIAQLHICLFDSRINIIHGLFPILRLNVKGLYLLYLIFIMNLVVILITDFLKIWFI